MYKNVVLTDGEELKRKTLFHIILQAWGHTAGKLSYPDEKESSCSLWPNKSNVGMPALLRWKSMAADIRGRTSGMVWPGLLGGHTPKCSAKRPFTDCGTTIRAGLLTLRNVACGVKKQSLIPRKAPQL
jgi:hypothetical protein